MACLAIATIARLTSDDMCKGIFGSQEYKSSYELFSMTPIAWNRLAPAGRVTLLTPTDQNSPGFDLVLVDRRNCSSGIVVFFEMKYAYMAPKDMSLDFVKQIQAKYALTFLCQAERTALKLWTAAIQRAKKKKATQDEVLKARTRFREAHADAQTTDEGPFRQFG